MDGAVTRGLLIGAAMVLALARAAAAQSGDPDLAAIARQAESAKATAPKAKKTYTNADLGADANAPDSGSTPPASGFMSTSLGKPVSAEEMLKLSEAKAAADQREKMPDAYWTQQANSIRKQVEKMAPRLAELTARPVNPNAALQKRAEQERAVIEEQLRALRRKWAGLEADAKTAKANLGLLSPPPAFPE